MSTVDSFGAKDVLNVNGADYEIYRLDKVEGYDTLPYSLKVLLENQLRTEDGANVTAEHIKALGSWDKDAQPNVEIQFTPDGCSCRTSPEFLRGGPRHDARGRR